MGTTDVLASKGLLRKEDEPLQLHHLISCRMFAKIVWTDKMLLKIEAGFDADRLHEILHANDDYFYDVCPGDSVVERWYREFAKEVA